MYEGTHKKLPNCIEVCYFIYEFMTQITHLFYFEGFKLLFLSGL